MGQYVIEVLFGAFGAFFLTLMTVAKIRQAMPSGKEWLKVWPALKKLHKNKAFAVPFYSALLPYLLGVWQPRVIDGFSRRDRSEYNFEGRTAGWVEPKDDEVAERGAALTEPGLTDEKPIRGAQSLSVQVQLDGSEGGRAAHKNQGEVMVYVKSTPPRTGASGQALDLRGRTASALVQIPDQALVSKIGADPIYLQPFFETCSQPPYRFNGSSEDIHATGIIQLRTKLFDSRSSDICKIGVKLGLKEVDRNRYDGHINVDSVDWCSGWAPLCWLVFW